MNAAECLLCGAWVGYSVFFCVSCDRFIRRGGVNSLSFHRVCDCAITHEPCNQNALAYVDINLFAALPLLLVSPWTN